MLQCQALLRWPDYVRIRSERQGFINLWTSLSPPMAVVYKEISKMDGFVITAYFTSKLSLEKEVVLWQKK
jgi:hypothetical protein